MPTLSDEHLADLVSRLGQLSAASTGSGERARLRLDLRGLSRDEANIAAASMNGYVRRTSASEPTFTARAQGGAAVALFDRLADLLEDEAHDRYIVAMDRVDALNAERTASRAGALMRWDPRAFTAQEISLLVNANGRITFESGVRVRLRVHLLDQTTARQLAQHLDAKCFPRGGAWVVQIRSPRVEGLLADLLPHLSPRVVDDLSRVLAERDSTRKEPRP